MTPLPIAIVGLGKIALDQHLPTLSSSNDFICVGAVTRTARESDPVPSFRSISELVRAKPGIRALSLCTPPHDRLVMVQEAFAHGLHVMIEKPPAATQEEADALVTLANTSVPTLFATWHSREGAAIEPARRWLAGRTIRHVRVQWKENVREWHPGQEWIWEPNIGVFDPGINALSILTHILPVPLTLHEAELHFPANRAAPIAAELAMRAGDGIPVAMSIDFNETETMDHSIHIDTDDGHLHIGKGGSYLALDGAPMPFEGIPEYARLYERFADLIARGKSDVDMLPFHLARQAFAIGRRVEAAPFHWAL